MAEKIRPIEQMLELNEDEALSAEHLDSQVQKAQEQLLQLRRQQEQIEKQKRELEELSRRQDRKSTRLNSSHSQISYAVFCLKKKKKNKSLNEKIKNRDINYRERQKI